MIVRVHNPGPTMPKKKKAKKAAAKTTAPKRRAARKANPSPKRRRPRRQRKKNPGMGNRTAIMVAAGVAFAGAVAGGMLASSPARIAMIGGAQVAAGLVLAESHPQIAAGLAASGAASFAPLAVSQLSVLFRPAPTMKGVEADTMGAIHYEDAPELLTMGAVEADTMGELVDLYQEEDFG